MSMKRRVAVIGGGVVGCATAYQLTRDGFEVTLLERDAIAAHASGRNAGNLNPLQGTPPALVPFALEAFRLHARIQEELAELGCARCVAFPMGRLYLGYEEADRPRLEAIAGLFASAAGFSSKWLPREHLRRIEPRLADDTLFGVLAEGNRTIDGYEFTRSLAEGASRLGCSVLRMPVSDLSTRGDRVTGINTPDGVIACDELVLATGPWTAEVHSWLGVVIPVEPLKGEILLMRTSRPPPACDLTWDDTSIYRRGEGEVWIGTTMKQCGFDERPTAEARDTLLSRAARMMPELEEATVQQHMAALRPMSRSNAPIAARVPGWQNAYIANGGGSKGLLLSVGIGRAIVELLTNGRTALPAP